MNRLAEIERNLGPSPPKCVEHEAYCREPHEHVTTEEETGEEENDKADGEEREKHSGDQRDKKKHNLRP